MTISDQFADGRMFDDADYDDPNRVEALTLRDRFLVPPFSTLDARAGYWQQRKRQWIELGIKGEVPSGAEGRQARIDQGADGRKGNLLGFSETVLRAQVEGQRSQKQLAQTKAYDEARGGMDSAAGRLDRAMYKGTPREGYGGDWDLTKGESAWGGAGTSIFDPMLCELLYRWFTPRAGRVLDPFAGGSVRGIVAAALERHYVGVDLRPEQVAANEQQRAALAEHWPAEFAPRWLCADSRSLHDLMFELGGMFDFVMSCPPYYDLERYSDDPQDISNASTYDEFLVVYREIIEKAAALLRPNRFAAFVVGDIRDKRSGIYRGFVADTCEAFERAGLELYNEAVLLTAVGSLPIRASKFFRSGRKLGRSHQNVLVFVKGDWREAVAACGPLGEVALAQGERGTTEEDETDDE